MKRALPITTALVSSVSLAWGADMPSRMAAPQPPAPVPIFSWSGPYAGVSLGFSSLNDSVTHLDTGDGCWWTCSSLQGLTDRSSGLIGGVQAGYNWQYQSVVFGLVADFSAASNSGSFDTFCSPCDYSQNSRLSALGTVRGRLGYAFDRSLLYVTGGWAIGDIKNHVNSLDNAAVWNSSGWRNGWTAGGGLDYALSTAWTAEAEALYYNLRSESVTFVYTGYGTLYYPARFKDDGVIARVGLTYRFGAPVAPVSARF